jgi:N-acyl-D-aspartate/D-glutamate deacylase
LVQRASGFKSTIVNGEVLIRDGEHSGAYPGRLLRGSLATAGAQ